jgi:hypothetical protein
MLIGSAGVPMESLIERRESPGAQYLSANGRPGSVHVGGCMKEAQDTCCTCSTTGETPSLQLPNPTEARMQEKVPSHGGIDLDPQLGMNEVGSLSRVFVHSSERYGKE